MVMLAVRNSVVLVTVSSTKQVHSDVSQRVELIKLEGVVRIPQKMLFT